jgi:hypothetical protein
MFPEAAPWLPGPHTLGADMIDGFSWWSSLNSVFGAREQMTIALAVYSPTNFFIQMLNIDLTIA